ncbi:MAG: four-helix bundle copper-binding protein [Frankiales bacterium]|nr:four-helix bundle copper-binding protein [Frankiales bacterium]
MPYIQQLLGTKAMRGHLRWRPAALDTYMKSADLKLERLLAAKTAVDLAVDDDLLSDRADDLLAAVLAVGQADGDGARDAAADQLKEARLAFLAEGAASYRRSRSTAMARSRRDRHHDRADQDALGVCQRIFSATARVGDPHSGMRPTSDRGAPVPVAEMLNSYPAEITMDRAVLADCIEACLDCTQACTACADICSTTANVLSRHTGYDANLTRALVQACATACKACGDECDQHRDMHEHCRICADACRRCEQACQAVLAAIG